MNTLLLVGAFSWKPVGRASLAQAAATSTAEVLGRHPANVQELLSLGLALQQLQASGVRVHFSKERIVPPPSSRKRPHEDAVEGGAASSSSSSSSDTEGARTVLLAGSESAIASVKTLLASIEAHAAAAKAHSRQRVAHTSTSKQERETSSM